MPIIKTKRIALPSPPHKELNNRSKKKFGQHSGQSGRMITKHRFGCLCMKNQQKPLYVMLCSLTKSLTIITYEHSKSVQLHQHEPLAPQYVYFFPFVPPASLCQI
uniref:Uncharacterized protein n=1 Tax=Arundo donax TaxID=35708 RepID=A0A0A9GWA6_ARUDO